MKDKFKELQKKHKTCNNIDDLLPATTTNKEKYTPTLNDAEIDTSLLLNHATKLLAENLIQACSDNDITPSELHLSKLKTQNLMDSISNVIEVTHGIELIKAQKSQFKRADELTILNSLRTQYEAATEQSDRTVKLLSEHASRLLDKLENNSDEFTEEDWLKLSTTQRHLYSSVDLMGNIGTGIQKLIKTERDTGGRSTSNRGSIRYEKTEAPNSSLPDGPPNRPKPRMVDINKDLGGYSDDDE